MKHLGFTVVEMLIVITIALILLLIGVPAFKETVSSSNIISISNEMLGAFNYARMEAVKRGNQVRLGQRDGSSWTCGIVVWVDTNGDTTLDAGEELRLWAAFNSANSVVSTNSRTSFIFSASGEVNNDEQFVLCDNRTGELGRKISILTSGAVFIEKVICG